MNLHVGTDDVRSQLRNPMKHARGLGSAKSGVEHWWVQRLTAAALVALIVVAGLWPDLLLRSGTEAAQGLLDPQRYIAAVGLEQAP